MMMMGIKQEDRNLSVCIWKKTKNFLLNFWIWFLEIILFSG
jgi:hypothetical protein